MSNLVIFEAVGMEQVSFPSEDCIKLAWSETAPELNDLVSMGQAKSWKVVKVIPYQAVQDSEVKVHLALVSREDSPVPPETAWYLNSHPPETIQVNLEEVGKPELQFLYNCLEQAPNVGESVETFVDTGIPSTEGSTYSKPEQVEWVVDSFHTYLPMEACSYSAIYLAWCKSLVTV